MRQLKIKGSVRASIGFQLIWNFFFREIFDRIWPEMAVLADSLGHMKKKKIKRWRRMESGSKIRFQWCKIKSWRISLFYFVWSNRYISPNLEDDGHKFCSSSLLISSFGFIIFKRKSSFEPNSLKRNYKIETRSRDWTSYFVIFFFCNSQEKDCSTPSKAQ